MLLLLLLLSVKRLFHILYISEISLLLYIFKGEKANDYNST